MRGLQKKFFAGFSVSCITLFICVCAWGQEAQLPSRPQGYVNDYANIIDYSDEQAITRLASELESKTTAQLAVVTMASTAPETIEGYAVRLFEKWGIGQREKNNGILLLVAYRDRKMRIETGYGLEGALPDVICHKIITDIMTPNFKSGMFSKGIREGASAIVSLTAKEYDVDITGQETAVYERMHRQPTVFERILNFIFTLMILMFFISMRTGLLGWFFMGSLLGGRRRGGYWYGSGMSGSGGGFGGGFGGFGGGFSGGGGASGGW